MTTTRISILDAALVGACCLLIGGCSTSPVGTAAPPPASNGPAPVAAGAASAAIVAAPATGKPCSWLTQKEVDAATGEPLGPGAPTMANDCSWGTKDFAAGVDVTFGDWDANIATFRASGKPPSPIDGIGDDALVRTDAAGSFLYFRKGSTAYSINIHGPRVDGLADKGLSQEKILAAALLGRV
jgi:hypothetical protein